ncbi:MAG: hypothetical protein LIP08_09765 [Bacteroides sp.]|nr:hypothetical protein [Bacteroides sp.]
MKTIPRLLLFTLISVLYSCHNDEANVEKELAKLYYNFSIDEPRIAVSAGDLLTLEVGTTFFIYTDSDYDSISTTLEFSEHLRSNPVSSQVYVCTALQTGQAYILLFVGKDYVGMEQVYLIVDVEPVTAAYSLITSSNGQVIDVDNEVLLEKIEEELNEKYAPPASLTRLTFTYLHIEENLYTPSIYTKEGSFIWTNPISQEILAEGSFSENNPNRIDLVCDDHTTYGFTSWATDTEEQFIWKQDLTEIFLEKYPSEIIREVSIHSSAHKIYQ